MWAQFETTAHVYSLCACRLRLQCEEAISRYGENRFLKSSQTVQWDFVGKE